MCGAALFDRSKNRQAGEQAGRPAGGHADGQAGWQAGRMAGGQAGRRAGRQVGRQWPTCPTNRPTNGSSSAARCPHSADGHRRKYPPTDPPPLPQVFILNGATYDQRFLDATRTSSLSRADSSNPDSVAALNTDLDDCALLTNNKGKPLLASLAGGKMTAEGRLLIQAVVSGRMRIQG